MSEEDDPLVRLKAVFNKHTEHVEKRYETFLGVMSALYDQRGLKPSTEENSKPVTWEEVMKKLEDKKKARVGIFPIDSTFSFPLLEFHGRDISGLVLRC